MELSSEPKLECAMKIFLHDSRKGLYYADFNRWSDKVEERHDFGSIETAMLENFQRGISATDVVVISEEPPAVIKLSMDSSRL
jgi:hypothetical protein